MTKIVTHNCAFPVYNSSKWLSTSKWKWGRVSFFLDVGRNVDLERNSCRGFRLHFQLQNRNEDKSRTFGFFFLMETIFDFRAQMRDDVVVHSSRESINNQKMNTPTTHEYTVKSTVSNWMMIISGKVKIKWSRESNEQPNGRESGKKITTCQRITFKCTAN